MRPTVAPAPAPDVAFGDGFRGGGLAGFVGRLRIRTNRRIAQREIVDDGAGDDGDAHAAAPVESAFLILHVADHPGVGAETELPAAREEQTVDGLNRADRLQQHDTSLTRRRSVVVDAGAGIGIEQDRGAAGRAPRVGPVADSQARHVGQRSGGRLRVELRRRGRREIRRARDGRRERPPRELHGSALPAPVTAPVAGFHLTA